jgi:fructose-bisphosphate aldolase, class I
MLSKLEIQTTAEALVADGKGILAADESFNTIQKRFDPVGIPSTADNRRLYREMLFTTPGIEEFISGVILFDETIRQEGDDGTPFPELLMNRGIIPGIKVDKGTKPLSGYPGEKVTEGIDGLRERLVEYRALGARFAKWRAIFSIGPGLPSKYAITANAHLLSRYAMLCQESGLTPIVEPEVLMDGPHHICACEDATCEVLVEVFNQLREAHVLFEGILLKPNMILAGSDFQNPSDPDEVADATHRVLRRSVPAAVPGIVFLSGGQDDVRATVNLNEINKNRAPWKLTFSYGRALQAASLNAWNGRFESTAEAQRKFYHRAKLCSLAARGEYSVEMEQETA